MTYPIEPSSRHFARGLGAMSRSPALVRAGIVFGLLSLVGVALALGFGMAFVLPLLIAVTTYWGSAAVAFWSGTHHRPQGTDDVAVHFLGGGSIGSDLAILIPLLPSFVLLYQDIEGNLVPLLGLWIGLGAGLVYVRRRFRRPDLRDTPARFFRLQASLLVLAMLGIAAAAVAYCTDFNRRTASSLAWLAALVVFAGLAQYGFRLLDRLQAEWPVVIEVIKTKAGPKVDEGGWTEL